MYRCTGSNYPNEKGCCAFVPGLKGLGRDLPPAVQPRRNADFTTDCKGSHRYKKLGNWPMVSLPLPVLFKQCSLTSSLQTMSSHILLLVANCFFSFLPCCPKWIPSFWAGTTLWSGRWCSTMCFLFNQNKSRLNSTVIRYDWWGEGRSVGLSKRWKGSLWSGY